MLISKRLTSVAKKAQKTLMSTYVTNKKNLTAKLIQALKHNPTLTHSQEKYKKAVVYQHKKNN